jgi:hypothetical protein
MPRKESLRRSQNRRLRQLLELLRESEFHSAISILRKQSKIYIDKLIEMADTMFGSFNEQIKATTKGPEVIIMNRAIQRLGTLLVYLFYKEKKEHLTYEVNDVEDIIRYYKGEGFTSTAFGVAHKPIMDISIELLEPQISELEHDLRNKGIKVTKAELLGGTIFDSPNPMNNPELFHKHNESQIPH